MDFSAKDINQLSDLLAPPSEDTQQGVFAPTSVLCPGSLGSQSSPKPKAQPNHKVTATINRQPPQPKKEFKANGRPEPEHEVFCFLIGYTNWCLYYCDYLLVVWVFPGRPE